MEGFNARFSRLMSSILLPHQFKYTIKEEVGSAELHEAKSSVNYSINLFILVELLVGALLV